MCKRDSNYNIHEEDVRITMFMTIRSELQCLTWQGPNYNIYKEKVRITMFVRIKSELQCLKG